MASARDSCPTKGEPKDGVAALLNKSVDGQEYIQLFYNTPKKRLALALYSSTTQKAQITAYDTNAEDREGDIVLGSQLGSAVKLYGLNLVVGLTRRDHAHSDVAVLSPSYCHLATTAADYRSVAVCSSAEDAFVYYLRNGPNNIATIQGVLLNNISPFDVPKSPEVRRNSSLAAYWNEDPYVIYQAPDLTLEEYSTVNQNSVTIPGSTGAYDGTTVAVTRDENGKTYLYYTNDKLQIVKCVKTGTKWHNKAEIPAIPTVYAKGQLTVVTANKRNHLFYRSTNATNPFYHFIDALEP